MQFLFILVYKQFTPKLSQASNILPNVPYDLHAMVISFNCCWH